MLRTRILRSHPHPYLHWQAGVTWSVLTAALVALLAFVILVTPRAALAAPGSEEFTEPGTEIFTVPAGVTALTVELWGGGGGGGGGTPNGDDPDLTLSGGGGGGGEYAGVTLDVKGGMVFEIVVGTRGDAGIPGGAGGAGGDSSFTEIGGEERTLTAHGGLGGLANGTSGAGGTGATGTGVVAHSGGAGGGGGNSDDEGKPRIGGGGGGGAGGPGSAGGAGSDGNCVLVVDECSSPTGGGGGNAGTGLLAPLGKGGNGAGTSAAQSGGSPGGGGGGGSSMTALAGAAGGFGQVRISWDSAAASEAESTITATPEQVAADGEEATTIKVVANDAEGEPIHGALVMLEAGPTSGLTVTPDVGVYTNSLGEATFTATRTSNGLVVFTAVISTYGNPDVELEASVQFGEGEDGEGCADPPVEVGQFSPALAASGITIATWGGGHVALFPDATSFWTTHEGALMGYIPGAPAFVNQGFINVFSSELPACMGFIVRT